MSKSGESGGTVMIGCAVVFIGAIALGLFGLFGFLSYAGLRDIHQQAHLMEHAEAATAVITRSEVLVMTKMEPRSSGPMVTGYLPDIEFRVTGSTRSLTGTQIFPAQTTGDEAWAQELVRRYPVGREVTAWIGPDNDDPAFLEKVWVTEVWGLLCGLAVCLSILTSIVTVASFLLPVVSRSVAGLGVLGTLSLTGYTAVHYLSTAGAEHFGLGWPEILAAVAVIFALLPLLAWRQGQRWYGKLRPESI